MHSDDMNRAAFAFLGLLSLSPLQAAGEEGCFAQYRKVSYEEHLMPNKPVDVRTSLTIDVILADSAGELFHMRIKPHEYGKPVQTLFTASPEGFVSIPCSLLDEISDGEIKGAYFWGAT